MGVQQHSAAKTDTRGFVAYNAHTNAIIIAFRGTVDTSIKDWVSNLDAIRVRYKDGDCGGCKVHQGFQRSWEGISADVLKLVADLRQKYPTAVMEVAGHSAGGSLAVFTALKLELLYPNAVSRVYTYGQPRVGDAAFVQYFSEKLSGRDIQRVVHWRDLVPHVPTEWMGFRHIGPEVFYNEVASSYTVCADGEDKHCSDSLGFTTSIQDHLYYMNISMGRGEAMCNATGTHALIADIRRLRGPRD